MFWATAIPLTLIIVGTGLVFTGEIQLLGKGLSNLLYGRAREVVIVTGRREKEDGNDDDNDSDDEPKKRLRRPI